MLRRIPCVKRQAFVAALHGRRPWNQCKLTGNVRQSPNVIWFHFLKFTWISHRIHLFLHFLQLRSELLYCLVVFFLIFALRFRLLVVLELSSLLPFRAYFGFEYFGELFLSYTILLVVELVLVQIQQIRIVRPVTPIFTPDRANPCFIPWIHHLHFFDPEHIFRWKIRTSSRLSFWIEFFETKNDCGWGKFVELQLWYLLSPLSNHRALRQRY